MKKSHKRPPLLPNVIDILKAEKPVLRRQFGVTQIGVFGSVLNGTAHANSDIDIAIELEGPDTFTQFFDTKDYLESKLNAKVDLGIEHSMKPEIRKQVQIFYV